MSRGIFQEKVIDIEKNQWVITVSVVVSPKMCFCKMQSYKKKKNNILLLLPSVFTVTVSPRGAGVSVSS